MAIILRADGAREDVVSPLSILQIQTIIGSQKIKEVEVPNCFNIMLVDEQGEQKDKNINVPASHIAQQVLYGDIILCVKYNNQYQ